jgi:hypothetical protein
MMMMMMMSMVVVVVVMKFQDHKNVEFLGILNNHKFLKGECDHVVIIIWLQVTLDGDIPVNPQTNQLLYVASSSSSSSSS